MAKQNKQVASTVAKLSAAAAACKANAHVTAQPGIISSIMQQLIAAKTANKPVSVQQLLSTLKQQFPTRTETGMLITVRAQLSRLPQEREFAISKLRKGRCVLYAAK